MSCHFPLCPTGELFAQAPIKEYPGVAVETVSDSSRYFVLRIQDDNGEDVHVLKLHFWRLWIPFKHADVKNSVLTLFMSVTVTSPLVCRSQCFHRSWLRRPRGCIRFQRGFAGSFQVKHWLGGFSEKTWLSSSPWNLSVYVHTLDDFESGLKHAHSRQWTQDWSS